MGAGEGITRCAGHMHQLLQCTEPLPLSAVSWSPSWGLALRVRTAVSFRILVMLTWWYFSLAKSWMDPAPGEKKLLRFSSSLEPGSPSWFKSRQRPGNRIYTSSRHWTYQWKTVILGYIGEGKSCKSSYSRTSSQCLEVEFEMQLKKIPWKWHAQQ